MEPIHFVELFANLYIQNSCSLKDSCSSSTTISSLISSNSRSTALAQIIAYKPMIMKNEPSKMKPKKISKF